MNRFAIIVWGFSKSGEEKESPGCAAEEPAESNASQRSDSPVPGRRARRHSARGERSRSAQGRAVAAPDDRRGLCAARMQTGGVGQRLGCRLATCSRSVGVPARPGRPGARPDFDGAIGRRPRALLSRAPAARRASRSKDEVSSRWATGCGSAREHPRGRMVWSRESRPGAA